MGIQNIYNADGFSLAITGMAIVFLVLVLVSLFIAWLPRVLPVINGILPVVEHHHHSSATASAPRAASLNADEETAAAIGFALHHRKGGG